VDNAEYDNDELNPQGDTIDLTLAPAKDSSDDGPLDGQMNLPFEEEYPQTCELLDNVVEETDATVPPCLNILPARYRSMAVQVANCRMVIAQALVDLGDRGVDWPLFKVQLEDASALVAYAESLLTALAHYHHPDLQFPPEIQYEATQEELLSAVKESASVQ